MDILNVLEKATQINSVSGSENEIRKFISDNVKSIVTNFWLTQWGILSLIKRQRQKDYVRGTYGRDWYNCNRY